MSNRDNDVRIGIIAGIVLAPFFAAFIAALTIVCVVMESYAVFTVWHWFLVPYLNFPEINFGLAIVLTGLVSFTTGHPNFDRPKERDFNMLGCLSYLFIRPWFFLGCCWVIKWYFVL